MQRLLERRLGLLYDRDSDGRILATRDVDPRPAPRLHLTRSAEGNAWALGRDVEADCADVVTCACAHEALLARPEPDRAPACRERVLQRLAPFETEWRGPAYRLPRDLRTDPRARLATAAEVAEIASTFPWVATGLPHIEPVAIAWCEQRPVSVCHSPRGVTALAAEAGVETLEPFRGRGYATAAVACWARAVQQMGRLALYSTSWDNAASQAVATRLSAQLYGEDWSIGPPSGGGPPPHERSAGVFTPSVRG